MKFRYLLIALALFSAVGAFGQTQFEALVVAIPNKYHYEYIPIARRSFEDLARHHQFQLTYTSDPAIFETDLKKFAVIVFLNTPAEVLNEKQRKAFQDYVHAGGGVMLVHKAIATAREWDWYERLIGRSFINHPYVQTAVVHVTDPNFPAAFPIPSHWIWSDEWYVYTAPYSNDLKTVLTVDEATYDPLRIWAGQTAHAMGTDHPVAWYHQFEGARVFVTALGHMADLYTDQVYLEHLYGGLWWAATGKGIATPR